MNIINNVNDIKNNTKNNNSSIGPYDQCHRLLELNKTFQNEISELKNDMTNINLLENIIQQKIKGTYKDLNDLMINFNVVTKIYDSMHLQHK